MDEKREDEPAFTWRDWVFGKNVIAASVDFGMGGKVRVVAMRLLWLALLAGMVGADTREAPGIVDGHPAQKLHVFVQRAGIICDELLEHEAVFLAWHAIDIELGVVVCIFVEVTLRNLVGVR